MNAPISKTALPWLTVGIAAYNNADYIQTAIQSVLKQTDERVEIIVVNDGSKDDTLDRIQALFNGCDAQTQQRITIVDQQNSGVSKVRNLAIERSRAPYITFLDGDDYWLDNYYQSILALVGNVDTLDADIIEYDALEHRQHPGSSQIDYKLLKFNPIEDYNGPIRPDQLEKIFARSKWYIWTRIYKKALFDELRFPENLRFEDIMLIPQLYLRIKKIIATQEALIAYRVNLGGQVANPTAQVIKDIESIIEIHLELSRQQQEEYKKKLLVLLACQSALYYKIITNMRSGYIKSLADIGRVVSKIKPFKKAHHVALPLKTQLLFISPAAANFYTFLKTRAK